MVTADIIQMKIHFKLLQASATSIVRVPVFRYRCLRSSTSTLPKLYKHFTQSSFTIYKRSVILSMFQAINEV
ncbi:hypothetical protein FD24_GL002633 [Lactiplantibacillus pentosus DSM 20314]|uniref:Uncharacterized protein n=1 Tax=Lactiplantibacillus pentosus DSM 20314 TaxID=1423791 RepID=A0A837RBI6_LACPE|nr:hypothetical protein FD24_GL002633 [Lactiplantibacillus pentosus DSM 20314]